MEIAGTVLAVVPLIVEALKAYNTAYQRFRFFRHYAREVNRVYIGLRAQQCVLVSELELILGKTWLSGNDILSMLSNVDHKLWDAEGLDGAINGVLGKHSGVYLDLLKSIVTQLQELKSDLRRFDHYKEERLPVRLANV